MPVSSIKVLTFGRRIDLPYVLQHVDEDALILPAVAAFAPDIILTSGAVPAALDTAAFEIRKRWLHVETQTPLASLCERIEACYAFNLWQRHPLADEQPLVSVYTGTWQSGGFLHQAYESLAAQTYANWEWVVVDDHSDDGTWERLQEIARNDARVRPFRSGVRLARIGAVKDAATRLARGDYLVELDHDDMLVDDALAAIRSAFATHADVGMVYSNSASFFEDGRAQRFNDAFWQARYRETEYRGKYWLECLQPDIYDRFGPDYREQFAWFLTVGPHHVRAFRTSTFRELGGYNANLPVADDWDLNARFFLRSRCLLVPRLLYLYRYRDNAANATFARNQAIQDHLALGRERYAAEFEAFNRCRQAAGTTMIPADGNAASLPAVALADCLDARARDASADGCAALSFVVPHAVAGPLALRCVASIREFAPSAEIVLVANGCVPASELAARIDRVVHLDANLGFSAACSAGAAAATRTFVCFFNDDAAFVDATPRRLLEAIDAAHPVVAPYSNRAKPPQGDVPHERVPDADAFPSSVAGLCLMMPLALYRSLGGFDPRLLTYEDDDLCLRARNRGAACKVVAKAWVDHERHATFRALGLDPDAVMRRNRATFEAMRPRIRVIAIAKNESAGIAGFFAQFAPLTRDWALLDTGSSDDTVAIAQAFGARVASEPFHDFASARNTALERFAHGADWILMLDPDERLDPATISLLPELLFACPHDVLLAPLVAVEPDGSRREFVSKPFLFRNRAELRWAFKVHEKLIGSTRQALLRNACIEHIVALHDGARRAAAETLYARLMAEEPYFIDAAYRRRMREAWPILDYDRRSDARIASLVAGPLISVIVPTFCRGVLLAKAVESALAQDYINLDVVVVGDACPDLASATLPEHPRLRRYNLSCNHGAGGAVPRNHGIAAAAGKLIAYLDDDNAWRPDHLSTLWEALCASGAAFAFSSMSVDGRELVFAEPKRGGIDTSCLLHHRALIVRHGEWKNRIDGGYAHDWELVSRWLAAGEPWIATRLATLVYNADTSGQAGFVRDLR